MSRFDEALLQFGPATEKELPLALELIFQNYDESTRRWQIRAAQQEIAASGGVDHLILVARRESSIVAAMGLHFQAGHVASIWPPELMKNAVAGPAISLIEIAVETAVGKGVQLLQALLETDTVPAAQWLKQCQLQHVADLLYLVSPREAFPSSLPEANLAYEPCDGSGEYRTRLELMVSETYVQTRDCPAVHGLRSIAEVLDGYEAVGAYDPNRWLLVRERKGGSDIGCLLLADHPQDRQWELLYMGLAPSARGRKRGLEIVRHAQWLAREANAERMVLAVDAENLPAISLYAAAGFETWDRRSVFLRSLGK